jgi:hypothetical protein
MAQLLGCLLIKIAKKLPAGKVLKDFLVESFMAKSTVVC